MTKTKTKMKLSEKIQTLKQTNRGKAILKLIRWFFFFFALLIVCLISNFIKPTNNNYPALNTKEEPQIENGTMDSKEAQELLSFLIDQNYNFKYEITLNEAKYIYTGSKIANIIEGFKETNISTIKYYIDETGEYEETLTNKTLIDNLYEGLNTEYLKPEPMVNFFSSLEYKYEKNNKTLKLNTTNEGLNITMLIEDNNLQNINIKSLEYEYNLTFEVLK